MFIWSIVWFWFKIEYIIDIDTNKSFYLSLFPSISYLRSYADPIDFRKHQFSINFLNLTFNLHYYYPNNYFFDKNGNYIGMRIYPSVKIETIDFNETE